MNGCLMIPTLLGLAATLDNGLTGRPEATVVVVAIVLKCLERSVASITILPCLTI